MSMSTSGDGVLFIGGMLAGLGGLFVLIGLAETLNEVLLLGGGMVLFGLVLLLSGKSDEAYDVVRVRTGSGKEHVFELPCGKGREFVSCVR